MNERDVLDLLGRWYKLKRLNLVPPLWSDFYIEKTRFTLQERWKFYTLADSGMGPHGERISLTLDELREMVEQGERTLHERKEVCRETGNSTGAGGRRTGTEG